MKLWQWRCKSVCVGFVTLCMGAYAANFIPYVRPPYAMANDLEAVKLDLRSKMGTLTHKQDGIDQKLEAVMIEQRKSAVRDVRSQLIEATRYRCRAANTADHGALPFWTNRLQDLKLSYQQLTTEPWPDLDCNSF